MIKLLFLGVLVYFAYRIFIPTSLPTGQKDSLENEEDEYTDYEEVD